GISSPAGVYRAVTFSAGRESSGHPGTAPDEEDGDADGDDGGADDGVDRIVDEEIEDDAGAGKGEDERDEGVERGLVGPGRIGAGAAEDDQGDACEGEEDPVG